MTAPLTAAALYGLVHDATGSGAAARLAVQLTGPARHAWRVSEARRTAMAAARAHMGGPGGDPPETLALAAAILALDQFGPGGPGGWSGGASQRSVPCLRRLGKGRRAATDGDAWTAAIAEAAGGLLCEIGAAVRGGVSRAVLTVHPHAEPGSAVMTGLSVEASVSRPGETDWTAEPNMQQGDPLLSELLPALRGLVWQQLRAALLRGSAIPLEAWGPAGPPAGLSVPDLRPWEPMGAADAGRLLNLLDAALASWGQEGAAPPAIVVE